MSKDKIKRFSNAIYQNAMTGKQSIADILDKVENEEIRAEFNREYKEFDSVCDAIEEFSSRNKFKIEDNSFLEKSKLWMSINMSTMFDNSNRKILEMMLIGYIMGLSCVYSDKHHYEGINAELEKILNNLELIMDNNLIALKNLLKKYSR